MHSTTVAAQIVMCVYGFSRNSKTVTSRARRPYIALSCVMLGLFTYISVTDSIEMARTIINNPIQDMVIYNIEKTPWYSTVGTVFIAILISLGDSLLASIHSCALGHP